MDINFDIASPCALEKSKHLHGQINDVLSTLASPAPGGSISSPGGTPATPLPCSIATPCSTLGLNTVGTSPSDILKDVVAYVEVRSKHENRSHAVEVQLRSLGATVEPKISKNTTHILFRGGKHSTWTRASKKGIPLVSVLWIESCKTNGCKMPVEDFAASLDDNLTPVGLRKHLPKYKSMQPKNFEEEVADSMEKMKKKQKRQAKADKWKAIQSPITPLQFGSAGKYYVAESQPETPMSEDDYEPRNVSVPDTPPSMRAARTGIKPMLCGEDESLPSSPTSTINFHLPLYRRLFNSSRNNSPLSAKKDMSSDRDVLSSDASPTSIRSSEFSPENKAPVLSIFPHNKNTSPDSQPVEQVLSDTGQAVVDTAHVVKPTNSTESETPSADMQKPDGVKSDINLANSSKCVDREPLKKSKSKSKFKLLSPVDQPIEKLTSPKVAGNHGKTLLVTKSKTQGVTKDNSSKSKPRINSKRTLESSASDSDNLSLQNKRRIKNDNAISDSNEQCSTNVLEADSDGAANMDQKKESPAEKSVVNRRRSARLQPVSARLSAASEPSRDDSYQSLTSSGEQCSANNSANAYKHARRKSVRIASLASVSETEVSHSVSSSQQTYDNPHSASLTDVCSEKPASNTRRRSVRAASLASALSASSNSVSTSANKRSELLFSNRRVTEEFTHSQLGMKQKNACQSQELKNNASSRKGKKSQKTESTKKKNDSSSSDHSSAEDRISKPTKKHKKLNLPTVSENPYNQVRSIVTTSLHSDEQEIVHSVTSQLGGFCVENRVSERTSHVVCGSHRRTLNLLHAVSAGLWLVSMEWVLKSLESGEWLDEREFELHKDFPAARERRLDKVNCVEEDIFSSCGLIFVNKQTSPPHQDIVQLLQRCGAEVTQCMRKAQLCIGDGNKCQVQSVTELWVLDCIMANKLVERDSYIIKSS